MSNVVWNTTKWNDFVEADRLMKENCKRDKCKVVRITLQRFFFFHLSGISAINNFVLYFNCM